MRQIRPVLHLNIGFKGLYRHYSFRAVTAYPIFLNFSTIILGCIHTCFQTRSPKVFLVFCMWSLYCFPFLWGFFAEFLCKFIFRKTHNHKMLQLPSFSSMRGYQIWIFLGGVFCVYLFYFFWQIAPKCKYLSNDNCIYFYHDSVLCILEIQDGH